GCSSNFGGGICKNAARVRRDIVEAKILNPLKDKLLAPDQIKKAVAEMKKYYRERVRRDSEEAREAPRAVKELDRQIARLKKRQTAGDEDLTAEELQVV